MIDRVSRSQLALGLASLAGTHLAIRYFLYLRQKRKIEKFHENYPQPCKERLFGMAALLNEYQGSSEGARVKKRLFDELGVDKSSGASVKYTPWLKVFVASDPEVVKFLMTLRPSQVRKAGLSEILFADDPHGFMGGILYDEGENWQKSRKILSEEFNQGLVIKNTEKISRC